MKPGALAAALKISVPTLRYRLKPFVKAGRVVITGSTMTREIRLSPARRSATKEKTAKEKPAGPVRSPARASVAPAHHTIDGEEFDVVFSGGDSLSKFRKDGE